MEKKPAWWRSSEGILAGLALVYGAFYWRYSHVFDSDHGRWMYEVWRFAMGEIPYAQIPFQYPPLSLYLYGGVAKLFQGNIISCWVTSFVLYGLICVTGYQWLKEQIDGKILFPAALTAFFMAAYRTVAWGSAPLSVGTYSLAQPLGGWFLLVAALAYHRSLTKKSRQNEILCGMAIAGCFLTKQDFWIPAVFLLLFSRSKITFLVAAVTSFVGLAAVLGHVGVRHILTIVLGYKQATTGHLVRVLFVFTLSLGVYFFRRRLFAKVPPTLSYLALLALAIRARRGFIVYDWYFIFFDLPLALILMKSKPVVWLSAVCACLLALGNHHFLGIETLKTPRGNIRVPHVAAETYHRLVARLDELDPTHQQGVLPLRFQSLSLFLDRPNPTRMTQGFVLTDESTPDILKHIFETKPIILFSAGQEDVLPDHYTRPEKIDDLDTLLPAYEAIFEHYRRADGEYRIGPWDIFIPRESGNAVATLGS